MNKKLFSTCPVCDHDLMVSHLHCSHCQTQIDTQIPVPPFFRLPLDLQQFVLVFLKKRGNIREMEKELGISYPTVCKRLDMVNELLGNAVGDTTKLAILESLERGELTAEEAAKLLKGTS